MTDRDAVLELNGLDGTNPMGFLAGLGVLAVLEHRRPDARLWWTDTVVPRARLLGVDAIASLVAEVVADKEELAAATLLAFPPDKPAHDVKFPPGELREFLAACRSSEPSASLSAALVCETSLDDSGNAKPTDLHFTAGQQQFLDIVRELRTGVNAAHLQEALVEPWTYEAAMKTFMWDSTDDRDYALAATEPAKTTKRTIPGADWLAFRGLALLPVMPGKGRTMTPGASGGWKVGRFTWPLWRLPISCSVARTLMQTHPIEDLTLLDEASLVSRGIHRVQRSGITRSDKGGYGTFRPSQLVWSDSGRWPAATSPEEPLSP